MDNRYGDFTKPDGAPIPVQTWSFEHQSSAAEPWHEVHATFGTYGWSTGLRPVAELPAPLAAPAAGADPLGVAGWSPADYSLSRGIYKDPVHKNRYGVRGFVPEDFLSLGYAKPGLGVQYRTTVQLAESGLLHLVVSAPAAKKLWVDGRLVGETTGGDMCMAPVTLAAGRHVVEFRLTPDADRNLRAWWALVRHPERFARPDWIAAPGAPRKDSLVRFKTTWHLPANLARAALQFAVDAATPCSLHINGRLVSWVNVRCFIQPCDVLAWLHGGDNEVVVEALDPGQPRSPIAVLVDGLAVESSGQRHTLLSGTSFTAGRDGAAPAPVPAALGTRHDQPDTTYLWRRPHPLPRASWLEDEPADDTVVPVVPDAFPGRQAVERLRWTLPPGATAMQLPIAGAVRVFVNDAEVAAHGGRVVLPQSGAVRRVCQVRVTVGGGRSAGTLFEGPVTYEMGPGRMEAGDWTKQGLLNYSGGVRYQRPLHLDALPTGGLTLDLGRMRGTAEVRVNGVAAGVRIWNPYRFDISKLVRPGANLVEVLVLNTLGPYLQGHSATTFVFAGQEVSGMLGPVRLLTAG